ncbi:hypothetical protein GCM10027597_32130 [Saccharopolyspora tripterygii]
MHVFAQQRWVDEPQGFAVGQGDIGMLGEFDGDLHGCVAATDDDDALSGEWFGVAVVGGVHERAVERVEAGQCGSVGAAEAATGGDHDRRGVRAVFGVDGVGAVVGGDGADAVVGADVGVEGVCVAAEVVDDFVAVRVAVGVAGERDFGECAESGG